MVKFCSAYGCTNRFSENDISFHKFSLKDKSLLQKWIVATKRETFRPTMNSYLFGEYFFPPDFNFSKVINHITVICHKVLSLRILKEMEILKVTRVKTAASDIEIAITNLIPLQ